MDQLYKYRSINKYLIESLIKSDMFFALPKDLNDPFDCNIDIGKSLSNALVGYSGLPAEEILTRNKFLVGRLNEKKEQLGICALSLTHLETLMWSHYAENHAGLCILYEIPEGFINDIRNNFVGYSLVSYDEDGVTKWIQGNLDVYKNEFNNFCIELSKIYLTTKGPSWYYEKEARIIRPQSGHFGIPRTFLKKVFFGLNTRSRDRDLINSIMDKYYSGVISCSMERCDSDFGLTVK